MRGNDDLAFDVHAEDFGDDGEISDDTAAQQHRIGQRDHFQHTCDDGFEDAAGKILRLDAGPDER